MPKQKWAQGRPKKNWMEDTRKAMNERSLNEGQWEDTKQWSLGVRQHRKTFWNRYIYIYIYFIIHLYTFWVYPPPIIRRHAICLQQLVLIIFLDGCLLSWLGWNCSCNPARTTDSHLKRQLVPTVVNLRRASWWWAVDTPRTCRGVWWNIFFFLPLALQPIADFGLSKNVPPFCPIWHLQHS